MKRLLLLVALCFECYSVIPNEEIVNSYDVQAVQGGIAKLPCDISAPIIGDKIVLVIWFKEGMSTPIYSFDSRGKILDQARHWYDEMTLSGRATFQYNEEPSKLTLNGIKDSDSGTYRCRVDFKSSPSRNQRINLTVIVPPEKLSVLNEDGAHITHYILGPYNEGSSVDITCVATGGRPSPRVTWWQENALLDDTFDNLSDRRVRNVLHLENLQRKHLNTVYTCQASNNNLVTPISSAVTLNLNLRPQFVRLEGDNKPLSADNTYELNCNVVGARPAPVITWWKGSLEMKNTREIVASDNNLTTSVLTIVPTVEDHGKYLSCRAEQPLIPDSGIEDGWKLNIFHTPIVYLELGSNLNSSVIREGDDVYFECNIKSNPWVYKVSWRHNGKILYNNAAIGTIVSNQSLVLQNVNVSRAGLYTCVGSNQEGDGESNPVQLDIKFAPICRPGQNMAYGVAKQEIVKIPCDIEANPTSVKFTWKFNSSSTDVIDVTATTVIVDQTRSVATYTPVTDSDYGYLLCWASNEIGPQKEPCVFSISPAGKPDSLSNCTIINQTAQSIQIECTEGYDGGLPQQFLIEIFDSQSGKLVFNMTSKFPTFDIGGLKSGLGFHVELFAVNRKGKSSAVQLQAYTLKSAEKHIASIPVLIEMTTILGAIIGTASALTLCILMTAIIVKCKRCRKPVTNKDYDDGGLASNERHCVVVANDKPNDMAYAELSLLNQSQPHVIFKQRPLMNAQESILYSQVDLNQKVTPCLQMTNPHIFTMNNTLRRNKSSSPSYVICKEAQCRPNDADCDLSDNVSHKEVCKSALQPPTSALFLVNNNTPLKSSTAATRF